MYIYKCIHRPQTPLPSRLLYSIELSSLYYSVGPCWLSVEVCTGNHSSQHRVIDCNKCTTPGGMLVMGETAYVGTGDR